MGWRFLLIDKYDSPCITIAERVAGVLGMYKEILNGLKEVMHLIGFGLVVGCSRLEFIHDLTTKAIVRYLNHGELKQLIALKNPRILCHQESRLLPHHNLNIKHYNSYRYDHTNALILSWAFATH